MRDFKFYDKLLELNKSLYSGAKDFEDWKLLCTKTDLHGLLIALYHINNNETLFAIKGTDLKESIQDGALDFWQDVVLRMFKNNGQADNASKFYDSIKNQYKNIIFTGHSLGGSICQILNGKYGNEAITFEAYGTGKGGNNLINFGNIWDPIFMDNPDGHKGQVYLMDVPMPAHGRAGFTTHVLEGCGKPSKSKESTGKLESNKDYYKRNNQIQHSKRQEEINSYLRNGIALPHSNLRYTVY